MNDTTPEIEERISAMVAARSPVERLRMASSMFDLGRALVRIGLQRQNVSLSEEQLRAQLFLRLYGEDFAGNEIEKIADRIPDMKLDI